MNPNEIQATWNTSRNDLSARERQTLVEQFNRQVRRRRRFEALWLVQTFMALSVVTALAGWSIAVGKARIEDQWALLPLLTLPWLFAFHFLRRFFKAGSALRASGELSIIDSFRAALESNRAERTSLKLVGLLFVVMIPFLAVSVRQLETAGKVSGREVTSMIVFFGVVLLLGAGGIAARYFGRLVPQERRLTELLGEVSPERD